MKVLNCKKVNFKNSEKNHEKGSHFVFLIQGWVQGGDLCHMLPPFSESKVLSFIDFLSFI